MKTSATSDEEVSGFIGYNWNFFQEKPELFICDNVQNPNGYYSPERPGFIASPNFVSFIMTIYSVEEDLLKFDTWAECKEEYEYIKAMWKAINE